MSAADLQPLALAHLLDLRRRLVGGEISSRTGAASAGSVDLPFVEGRQRQVDVEGAALPGLAVEGHRAAVQGDQVAGDRQPQADAARDAPVILDGHERLEDAFLLVGRNAQAGVADPEVDLREA